jgi:YebC/PmpR family DNA-binding regulatory protein
MAGHSHWAGIKHKKALIDNRRGKLWSKLSKAIIIAAKAGGGDPATNLRLRYAINDAKAVSVPKDNIERAIKKGTGELEGANFEEVLYEGYGPGGVAVLCDILTDNRNRTAGEVRKLFEIAGGKLGATGCVAWMFDRKGLLVIPADQTDELALMEMALDAGADDVRRAGDNFEVICDPEVFTTISEAIDSAGLKTEVRQITRIPKDTVDLAAESGRAVLKLMDALDDHDDVQNVAANFNIPDDTLAQIEMAQA